ncbi:MAG TPA: exopolysaccharide biosynthesis protein [Stellaceae bacterium]|nr:exopolysaccharide biosynthesis protein [Stellaceae bacterium]
MPDQAAEVEGVRDRGHRFSDVLALFAETANGERVDLATIARFMGHRSIAALLLILALPMALPIPAPGISVLFGIPLILISAQLLFGRRRAWLPARLARQSINRAEFVAFVERALPRLRRLERIVRPRMSWLAGDWTMVPIGAISLILAIIITLPVPLGHMLPGVAISLLALGLLERDGLAIGIGLATAVLAFVVVAIATNGVATWLHAYLERGTL